MRGLLPICALAAFLGGCEPAPGSHMAVTHLRDSLLTLDYAQDPRTGLCFLGHAPNTTYGKVTNVPCTPAVLREAGR